MSSLPGAADDIGSDGINLFGNINLGNKDVNEVFSNLTLLSLILTTLRGNVVKGRSSFDSEYDYIIIGGGTAGCIMASRLSQHPCVNVLLLEAGGEQPILTDIPGFARIFLGTDIDWSYQTTPQQHCSYGQKENRVIWNSGKVLGGGSTLNAMLYVRGNKENFNQWARGGATGWSYDEVLPYFLKSEDNSNINEEDQGYHAQYGPMGVEKPKYNPELKKHLIEAVTGLGFPMTDINGRRQFGIYDVQGTMRNQERCSTSKAYLKPTKKRENLHIATGAFVRKILIRKTKEGKNRAVAVVLEHENKIYVVRIRQSNYLRDGFGEIIVSNGAVRTPQTLMLSGIGPKEQLEKFRIRVVADLPVGKNLMDHDAAVMLCEYDPLLRNAVIKEITPDSIAEYALFRTGPLTSPSQNIIVGFLNGLNNTSLPNDFPMQGLYFADYNTEDAVKSLNLREDIEKKVYTPYLLRPILLCYSMVLQPQSRGEVTLNSIDPHEYPNINPNYYADPRDEQNAVKGMKICKAVFEHPAMQKIKGKWIDAQRTGYPGCERFESNEDAYLGCIAKSVIMTVWHPVGTAKMGDPRDKSSVVDPQLRVIGVDKLRVVSAAIMPTITSGNTNAPTIMIAEKAYDMIKDSILCPSAVTIRRSHEVEDKN